MTDDEQVAGGCLGLLVVLVVVIAIWFALVGVGMWIIR